MSIPHPSAPKPSGIKLDPETNGQLVPSSRRSDGSVRKELKIRPGFTPQEDVARYRSPRVAAKMGHDIPLAAPPSPIKASPPAPAPPAAPPSTPPAKKTWRTGQGSSSSIHAPPALAKSSPAASPPPPPLTHQPSTTAKIDNENLKEQVAHLNKRIADFEYQIKEIRVQASEAELTFKRQLDQARTIERNLQVELTGVRAAKEDAVRAEEEAKRVVKELELALSQERGARAEAGGSAVPSNLKSGLENGQNGVEVDLLRQALSNAHLESEEQALQRQETAELDSKRAPATSTLNGTPSVSQGGPSANKTSLQATGRKTSWGVQLRTSSWADEVDELSDPEFDDPPPPSRPAPVPASRPNGAEEKKGNKGRGKKGKGGGKKDNDLLGGPQVVGALLKGDGGASVKGRGPAGKMRGWDD